MLSTSHSCSCLLSLAPTSGRTRTLTMTLPLPSFISLLSRPRPSSSPTSSKLVALVEYDPWGEELRLWGGDGRLRLAESTATESALPLSRLGGDRGDRGSKPRAPPIFDVLGFFRLLFRVGGVLLDMEDTRRSIMSPPGVELVDSGLVGFDRPICFGGWGNAPMLTVLRRDRPAGSGPARPLSAGSSGTEGEVVCFGLAR